MRNYKEFFNKGKNAKMVPNTILRGPEQRSAICQ